MRHQSALLTGLIVISIILTGCAGLSNQMSSSDDLTVNQSDKEKAIDMESEVVRDHLNSCDYIYSGIGGIGNTDTEIIEKNETTARLLVEIPFYGKYEEESKYAPGTRTPTPVETDFDEIWEATYEINSTGVHRITQGSSRSCR